MDEEYDFHAPFNGQATENDLMPKSYPSLDDGIPKKKKPIDETSRMPNTPWLSLSSIPDGRNDINFDVGDEFRFRMPTTENFKGRDVKFNVNLPQDLLGHGSTPAPTHVPSTSSPAP